MGGLSQDPRRRERQLANLKRGAQPAPNGNRFRVSHGAYAKVVRERGDAKVREIFDALAEDAPLRAADGELPAADGVAVRLLAECLCRLDSVSAYLTDHGLLNEDGQLRPAIEVERRLRLEAADHADSLGLSPRSRARLGFDLARAQHFDLAQRWADEDDDVIEAEVSGA